jgi:hypothetical protein
MTPFTIEFDQVDYMKFRPGFKLVLGPNIAIVMASCNKIHTVLKYVDVEPMKPMNNHPEVEALLLGA